MPQIDAYKSTDIQNSEEPKRQIPEKSVDRTASEARIENHSAGNNIVDVGKVTANIEMVVSSRDVQASSLSGSADAETGAVSGEPTGLESPSISGPSKQLRVSHEEQHNLESKDDEVLYANSVQSNGSTTAKTVSEYSENDVGAVKSAQENFPAADGFTYRADQNRSISNYTATGDGQNENTEDETIRIEEDTLMDDMENVSVEKAFEFLSEPSDDTYVNLAISAKITNS